MAWAFVGVNTSVEVISGTSLVMTEPAGVAAGDLLVACIASRTTATTSITLPAGWALVDEQNTNNTLLSSSAVASGMMCYIIRGASAPALTWTLPAGVSVALGRMVAYRGNATSSPVDVQNVLTTAVNVTALNVTGLTTTVNDDLLVVHGAGGQEGTWLSFNATSPSGASGTNSTATPTTAWLRRAGLGTTNGADVACNIFDGIKTIAGATGNFTCTISIGAGHAVIAAAFKIAGAAVPGMKAWTGSAWVEKPAKVWSGSAWVAKPVKVWNGSAWV